MNPLVHAELSWLVGARLEARRDRVCVTLAGLAPDLDGLSLLGGVEMYGEYHHLLTHGLFAALGAGAIVALFSRRKLATTLLALAAFHLHLLGDLVGSGPGWPIFYVWPVSHVEWFWGGQWDLASWQNALIGLGATLIALSAALWLGRTPVELFSARADARVVATLRARFGARP